MKILNKKIVGDTILYSIGEIIPRILSFLLLPVLTHYLSTADYGISSFTTTFMTFVFVIASLSLNTFVLKNYYAEPSDEIRKKIVGCIFLFICLFNVVLFLLQLFILPKAIDYYDVKIPFYPYFILAAANNFFDVISIVPLALYRVKGNVKTFLLLSLTRVILQYLLTYILIVGFDMGLLGSFLAKLFVNIPFLFIYFYLIFKECTLVISWDIIKYALAFSLPLLPASISFLIISISDRILLGHYISLDHLGVYSVAFTLALSLNIIIQALYKTFEQIIYKNYNSANFPVLNLKLLKIYGLCVSVGGLAIALFSKEIFTVIASKGFYYGNNLVPFMVISVIIAGINTYFSTLLIGANNQKLVSVLTLIAALVSIVLNLILIPKIGYFGAIVSSGLAVSFIFICSCVKLKIDGMIIYFLLISLFLVALMPIAINTILDDEGILVTVLIKVIVLFLFIVLSAQFLNFNLLKDLKVLSIKTSDGE